MWILYAILSSLFASCMTLFMKIGLKNIDANLATTLRTIIVVVFCLILVLATGKVKDIKTIDSRTWFFLLLAGIATFGTWVFYFLALQKGSITKVLAIDRISIILTIVLSAIFLNEKITLRVVIGGALLIIGTLIVVLK